MTFTPTPSQVVSRFLNSSPHRLLIGGRRVEGSGGLIDVIDPATEQRIAQTFAASASDTANAVAAARATFDSRAWRRLSPAHRARMLWRLGDLLDAHMDELAEMEVLNQGKPLWLAKALDAGAIGETCRYFAGWCTKLEGTVHTPSATDERGEHGIGPALHMYSLRQPIGVVAAIAPWNVPLVITMAKLAAALAAGCTIVLKPAEQTPLTSLRLGELAEEAGFPPGAINVIPGFGEVAGAALVSDPRVDRVTFTGSTDVGKLIARAAAQDLKRVSLELGGKSPVVIFADANLDKAIPAAADSIFINSGQMCFAGSRLYVEEPVRARVVAGIADIARSMRLGHGLDPDTTMGPLISAEQRKRVAHCVERGQAAGAALVCGGASPKRHGFFFEPTVLATDDPNNPAACEEIFGPVLVTSGFQLGADLSALVARLNDTPFGLAASVWTSDIARAHQMAAEIQAGAVWVNCINMLDDGAPMGGFKQSGWGYEGGRLGVEEFTQVKTVAIDLS